MKIAAVVILYHPTQEVIFNIKSYYDHVEKLFVFDNSETKSEIQDDLLKLEKIEFYHNFSNEGIAKRLNEASELALKEQFEWILTMDQDSHFSHDAITGYYNCFNKYSHKEKVAAFGPRNSRQVHANLNSCQSAEVKHLITSGMLVNLSVFVKIGGFDEALFIDAVDFDYCFRSQIAGYSIIEFSNIYLLHPIGDEVYRASVKTLFLFKKKKQVHSPLRCYYMYRNMLYLNKKYKKDEERSYSRQIRENVLSRIKVSLLYGRTVLDILKYLIHAKNDFMNNNMGKRKELGRKS